MGKIPRERQPCITSIDSQLQGITTVITSIFTCVPVSAYWRIMEKAGARCIKDET